MDYNFKFDYGLVNIISDVVYQTSRVGGPRNKNENCDRSERCFDVYKLK